MSRGILSPWAKTTPTNTAQARAEAQLENGDGRDLPYREVTFDGRSLQIIVGFYTFDKDAPRLQAYAHDALGRAITHALGVDAELRRQLELQSVATDAAKMLAPKVTLTLGALVLYVKASSFDPKLARLMATDRLALSLADARNASKKVAQSLVDHSVTIASKA